MQDDLTHSSSLLYVQNYVITAGKYTRQSQFIFQKHWYMGNLFRNVDIQ